MPDVNAKALDRLLAGELSHAEQRRLAQEALDDPELFDALTAAALTKAALETPTARDATRGVAVSRQGRRSAILAMLSAAAAVILAVAYGWTRWSDRPAAPATAATAPVLVAPPVLLTARVDTGQTQTFRTEAVPVRLPKDTGTVVSVRDGVADVDIGALDGLKQDMDLRILRGQRRVGLITTTAVFRERARGRVGSGDVRSGDRVEVDPAVTASAILGQATARRAAGDIIGARELAARAVSLADAASLPPDIRRRCLTELGKLTHEQGNLAEAARLFQQGLDTFDAAPPASPAELLAERSELLAERSELLAERSELLNELGAVQIERRDFAGAERTLQSAQAVAVGRTRMRVANNLGALAALRGDRAAANGLYRSAASLAGDSPDLAADRQAIEKNLAALQAAR
jgi:tetratricopeptide (TPR) repeat protein